MTLLPPSAALQECTIRIKLATASWEREATRHLRHAVFCGEQGLFDGDDVDAIDAIALPIAAVLSSAGGPGQVIGTVRIHEARRGQWWGSRLAVVRDARRQAAVGSGLIRLAVGTAHALGCRSFLAHVQSQNVPLFERLHWHSLRECELHGRLHHLMQADLAHYPRIVDGDTGFLCAREPA
jgi:putative N-acetyltransferase (TIGR04045 family)